MNENVKTNNLYDCKTEYLTELFSESVYPWEILPKIKSVIQKIIENAPEGFSETERGVLVHKTAKISELATVIGPAVIGENTEIRPGAFLRGNVIIGKGCVIGNSSELKNALLLDNVQVPHYNYVGDSVLGNFAHMGAGSICSNLKSDGKEVVIHADSDINTGLRKVGGFLADHADVGCGTVLNPGTVIGKNTRVYPLVSLRGVIPENSIVKSATEIIKRK